MKVINKKKACVRLYRFNAKLMKFEFHSSSSKEEIPLPNGMYYAVFKHYDRSTVASSEHDEFIFPRAIKNLVTFVERLCGKGMFELARRDIPCATLTGGYYPL